MHEGKDWPLNKLMLLNCLQLEKLSLLAEWSLEIDLMLHLFVNNSSSSEKIQEQCNEQRLFDNNLCRPLHLGRLTVLFLEEA